MRFLKIQVEIKFLHIIECGPLLFFLPSIEIIHGKGHLDCASVLAVRYFYKILKAKYI